MSPVPVVLWVCRWIGTFTASFSFLTRLIGLIGQQQVGHILDADGVRAHLLQLHGQVHEVVLACAPG